LGDTNDLLKPIEMNSRVKTNRGGPKFSTKYAGKKSNYDGLSNQEKENSSHIEQRNVKRIRKNEHGMNDFTRNIMSITNIISKFLYILIVLF
jgi:hypothetical protein